MRLNEILWQASLVFICYAVSEAKKTECYVDPNGDPLDPNNIYKCDVSQTCCREKGLPSCCSVKQSSVAMQEQATLWGCLVGFIVVLGIVIWCCRHDGDYCCNDKDGRKSCCGKSFGKKADDKYVAQDDDGRGGYVNEAADDEKKTIMTVNNWEEQNEKRPLTPQDDPTNPTLDSSDKKPDYLTGDAANPPNLPADPEQPLRPPNDDAAFPELNLDQIP